MTDRGSSRTTHPHRTLRPSVLARSLWAWDLQVALVVAASIGGVIYVWELSPSRSVFWGLTPVFVALMAVCGQFWHQIGRILSGSGYGHILRMEDRTETETRLPFEIALGVAFIAVVALTATGLLIQEIACRWVVAALVGGVAFFAVWSLLASVSVFRLMRLHKSNAAEMEADREELADARILYTQRQKDSRADPSGN